MSTDMQQYSSENQEAAIAQYALTRDIQIVRTYMDAAKSGLKIKGRPQLTKLLEDVRNGSADFDTILVYDISRWGRFQDTDESAHYEFLCRQAGFSIQYCAEQFENDGSLAATIIKNIKRAMAAEYSRELSTKVFAGKCNLVRKGFRHGGRAGYGLRRMMIDEQGARRMELKDGEQKFLHTDRIILIPGPAEEVKNVQWIFNQFVFGKASLLSIANDLNARGIKNAIGRVWHPIAVRYLLTNEKYIGNNVFNRTSVRLKGSRVNISPDFWVRADGAFEAIVEQEIFLAAQMRLTSVRSELTDSQLLDSLTALWCQRGRLSSPLMQKSSKCPSTTTYLEHFGSVLAAFERVGYRKFRQRTAYTAWRKTIADAIIKQIRDCGGTIVREQYCDQSRFIVNDELRVAIIVARQVYKNRKGVPRWSSSQRAKCTADLLIVATLDATATKIHNYIILPRQNLDSLQKLIMESNHIQIEAFRSETLLPLAQLFARQPVSSRALQSSFALKRPASKPIDLPNMSPVRGTQGLRRTAAVVLLRSYERHVQRMSSFIAKSKLAIDGQETIDRLLTRLMSDPSLHELLLEQGLDNFPAILGRRMN